MGLVLNSWSMFLLYKYFEEFAFEEKENVQNKFSILGVIKKN